MFTQLLIKNFRCFSQLEVDSLERINLIAGMNNTGKTALLEAIHFHISPADAALPIALNNNRGLGTAAPATDAIGWLFRDRQTTQALEVRTEDTQGTTRALAAWLLDAPTARRHFPELEKELREVFRPDVAEGSHWRLVLRYQQTDQHDRFSTAVFGKPGISSVHAHITSSIPGVFVGSGSVPSERDLRFFGELEASKRQGEILPALQRLEPRLQRLALVPLAGESVIHGDIGLPRLVPIPFMGEGIRRLLSLLLAIANARHGVVVIDEVENGLHWSVLKDVWKAIADAARANDVQVFATTHSWECIRYAHEAFVEDPQDDLRLHRLDRHGDQVIAVHYDRAMLEAALYTGLEMR